MKQIQNYFQKHKKKIIGGSVVALSLITLPYLKENPELQNGLKTSLIVEENSFALPPKTEEPKTEISKTSKDTITKALQASLIIPEEIPKTKKTDTQKVDKNPQEKPKTRKILPQNPSPIDSGDFHSCLLRENGLVYCWGKNTNGVIGNGNTIDQKSPVKVERIENIIAISAGAKHNCALNNIGKVFCWGDNSSGALGIGSNTPQYYPVEVTLPEKIKRISAGLSHTCAIGESKKLYCWGANWAGQVGIGNTTDAFTPIEVPGLENIKRVSVGGDHTCAISIFGETFCWGRNDFGQLGINKETPREILPQIITENLGEALEIRAGYFHTCAVNKNQKLFCWGKNDFNELGVDSEKEIFITPVLVPNTQEIIDLDAWGNFIGSHTCTLNKEGLIACFGENVYGQIGNERQSKYEKNITPVKYLTNALNVSVGKDHSCARTIDEVFCWGSNEFGQIGVAEKEIVTTPHVLPLEKLEVFED